MLFSDRLKSLRNAKGLTQGDLANQTGLKQSSIAMYETGKRKPKIEVLERLADFFNVDIDYLVGKSDKTTKILVEPSPSPAPAQPVTRGDMLMLTDKREITHIQKYRALDERGKDNVDATLEHEYEYASPEARAEKQSG